MEVTTPHHFPSSYLCMTEELIGVGLGLRAQESMESGWIS